MTARDIHQDGAIGAALAEIAVSNQVDTIYAGLAEGFCRILMLKKRMAERGITWPANSSKFR